MKLLHNVVAVVVAVVGTWPRMTSGAQLRPKQSSRLRPQQRIWLKTCGVAPMRRLVVAAAAVVVVVPRIRGWCPRFVVAVAMWPRMTSGAQLRPKQSSRLRPQQRIWPKMCGVVPMKRLVVAAVVVVVVPGIRGWCPRSAWPQRQPFVVVVVAVGRLMSSS